MEPVNVKKEVFIRRTRDILPLWVGYIIYCLVGLCCLSVCL